MTMIEKVARALMEARGGCDVTDWREAEWNPSVAQAVKEARTAIEAMREPTRVMIAKGSWARNGVSEVGSTGAENAYTRMIDAALSESQP